MSEEIKRIVEEINTAFANGDPETFLSHCSEDVSWTMVGEKASKELFDRAAQQAIAGAKPHKENAFKVEMAKRAVARALNVAGGLS